MPLFFSQGQTASLRSFQDWPGKEPPVFSSCTPQDPQRKAWLERRGKERESPPTANIIYYLYSLWKTGLKHRISIRKKRFCTNTHFFFYHTGQTKGEIKLKMAALFEHTNIFCSRWGCSRCAAFHPGGDLLLYSALDVSCSAPPSPLPTLHHHNSFHCYTLYKYHSCIHHITIPLVMLINLRIFTEMLKHTWKAVGYSSWKKKTITSWGSHGKVLYHWHLYEHWAWFLVPLLVL